MITFTNKILLAFSLKVKDKKKVEKPHPKHKGEQEVSDPPYLIRLDKTCATAHIEYQILPGKFKLYQIDVLCWPNGAKIYTADGTALFKTVTRRNLTFVPICIEHVIKECSIDDVLALRNSVIEFNVFTDKNKMGNAAKSNKTEVIYIKETDIDRNDFVEGYLEKLNQSIITKKSMQTKSDAPDDDVVSRSTVFQRNEGLSKMKFEENFADIFYEIIDYESDDTIPRDQIFFKDFVKTCEPPEEANPTLKESEKPQAPEKKAKKEAKPPKVAKVPGKLTLLMQGEIFFTDADSIFKLENYKSEISKVFVIPHVENLLTRLQKIQLNAIIVKVISIQNFPEELFENTGFTHIYCKYSIPHIAECKTIAKPIEATIRFMESHFYPTHTLSKMKLLEFLETKKLVVKVYGIQKYQHVEVKPKMFGEKSEDSKISQISTGVRRKCLEDEEKAKMKDTLLAHCAYDLSSLLQNVWDFKGKQQLHVAENPRASRFARQQETNEGNDQYKDSFWQYHSISMNLINTDGISFSKAFYSPLKEWILLQNNTQLGIEAYLLSPQSPALVLHQVPNTFKRLLLIAFEAAVARKFFEEILSYNQRIISENLKDENMLTGFVIDNGNNFAIYVEGRSIGYILNLWQELDRVTVREAKVFFNTDQAYENRLYSTCNKWVGFYVITMKIPLDDIFKNQKMYIKGNIPDLCQKALIKLNLMFLSKSMKTMFQDDLFPTLEELVSLDIEYGVAFSWKPFVASEISASTADTVILPDV